MTVVLEINIIKFVNHFYSDMNLNHQIIRFSYARISESIQAELNFLSALSENTDDERFKQSLIEMIYSLSDLSDTINLQRRYLKPRYDAE